ncbi:hypothetical protein CKAH01_10880 [Colletotrichum kahawae]|uniref:Uncharacterized protein n=1 Tax=Colletotrichum kahawae TaxID=34407 RepID=A0AAD9XVW9_COLKA|nr:hypothetical protein CKAH01_10880 [Colletotrichum kahawae]
MAAGEPRNGRGPYRGHPVRSAQVRKVTPVRKKDGLQAKPQTTKRKSGKTPPARGNQPGARGRSNRAGAESQRQWPPEVGRPFSN